MMGVQFIELDGKKMAVLGIDEYEALIEAIEDRDDCLLAAAADRRREAGEEYLPSEMVNRLVDGENALRVWREYRQVSLNRLAEIAGINKAMISQLENGKAHGRPATWRALAEALNVTVDDILPIN